jgi:hypothetical protein
MWIQDAKGSFLANIMTNVQSTHGKIGEWGDHFGDAQIKIQ